MEEQKFETQPFKPMKKNKKKFWIIFGLVFVSVFTAAVAYLFREVNKMPEAVPMYGVPMMSIYAIGLHESKMMRLVRKITSVIFSMVLAVISLAVGLYVYIKRRDVR